MLRRDHRLGRLVFITFALTLGASSCLHIITPVEMTRTAMTEGVFRIELYFRQNGSLPPSLQVLPMREGYMNRIVDGWNRPLLYNVDKAGIITLKSFGRDGKPGGDDEDADIWKSYYSRRADGSLWIGADELWIAKAEVGRRW